MNDKEIQILIACHKSADVPSESMYLPIQVGAAGKEEIGFLRDDTGDNISEINGAFSELTGLYWAWKNLHCRYLGLVHYRRYFTYGKVRDKKAPLDAIVLKEEEIRPLLYRHKIIVPKKRRYYIETLYSQYDHSFDGKQLDMCREILKEKYPSYVESFDAVMKQRSGYMFNMFITTKKMADAYCTWLFDVLFELVLRLGTSGLTDFEKRYPGRVSERLFNVWLLQKVKEGELAKDDIFELPYFYSGEIDWPRKVSSFLKAKFLHQKYDRSF